VDPIDLSKTLTKHEFPISASLIRPSIHSANAFLQPYQTTPATPIIFQHEIFLKHTGYPSETKMMLTCINIYKKKMHREDVIFLNQVSELHPGLSYLCAPLGTIFTHAIADPTSRVRASSYWPRLELAACTISKENVLALMWTIRQTPRKHNYYETRETISKANQINQRHVLD
jgi:hypothetical protein